MVSAAPLNEPDYTFNGQGSKEDFLAIAKDVFFDGHGPQREYVVDITWGEDVRPVIDESYIIMNAYSKKRLSVDGAIENLSPIIQKNASDASSQVWEIKPTPITIGGDFSYYTIKNTDNTDMKLDILNFSLEEGGAIIIYNGATGTNEQWYLKYAGNGYFMIKSRHSNLCLEISEESMADGVKVHQASPTGNPRQLWRFLPLDAPCETDAPDTPAKLTAIPQKRQQ